MKFIADEMLGKLAKWLRILGYDTEYFDGGGDDELVRRARAEGRILLTRDTALTRRKNLDVLFIQGDHLVEQLAQVVTSLNLSVARETSRCLICNTPLKKVSKSAARDRVPPYVFRTQDEFHHCASCDKYFWTGTHWQKMKARLARLRAEISDCQD